MIRIWHGPDQSPEYTLKLDYLEEGDVALIIVDGGGHKVATIISIGYDGMLVHNSINREVASDMEVPLKKNGSIKWSLE